MLPAGPPETVIPSDTPRRNRAPKADGPKAGGILAGSIISVILFILLAASILAAPWLATTLAQPASIIAAGQGVLLALLAATLLQARRRTPSPHETAGENLTNAARKNSENQGNEGKWPKDGLPKDRLPEDRLSEDTGTTNNSRFDPITGLPGRPEFLATLTRHLTTPREGILAANEEGRLALLFIRFGRASSLRSSLGPSLADSLMRAIAERLRDAPLPLVALARLSASSFGLLMQSPKSDSSSGHEGEAAAAAYGLSSLLAKPYGVGQREVQLNATIGVALSRHVEDAAEWLRHAEIAAQSAATTNLDEVVLFDVAMRKQLERRHQIESDLRRAIYFEREQLSLAFQPIVELKELRLAGFEALVRWHHPDHGAISPVEFIPIAEETGLIVPLWHFVFTLACRQLLDWQALRPRGMPPLFMSVNLSSFQFFYPGLLKSITALTELTAIEPAWVKLEITESGLMENAELALRQLRALKDIGFSLSIDDFGTGYSSLSYLHRLPVDDLKIDRSFVQNMHTTEGNREIVRTITQLGKLVGLKVTAEGVETEAELLTLRGLKCDYGQGYLFARPLRAADAENLVKAMGASLSPTKAAAQKN